MRGITLRKDAKVNRWRGKKGRQERRGSQRVQRKRILSTLSLRGKIWLICIHAKKIRNV